MKKISIVAITLIAACAWIAPADQMIIGQGAFEYTTRNYSSSEILGYSMAGINVMSFYGTDIGFLGISSFLLPVSATSGSASIDLNAYDSMKIGLDALAGIGYKMSVNDALGFIFGGGLHFNGIAFLSTSYTLDPFLSYVLGVGGNAILCFYFSPTVCLNIGATAAYDFYEIVHMPDLPGGTSYNGGFSINIGAGLGIVF